MYPFNIGTRSATCTCMTTWGAVIPPPPCPIHGPFARESCAPREVHIHHHHYHDRDDRDQLSKELELRSRHEPTTS